MRHLTCVECDDPRSGLHAAPFHSCKYRRLQAPATKFIRGASPLGLPYTVTRSRLRPLASACARYSADRAEAPLARRRAVPVARSVRSLASLASTANSPSLRSARYAARLIGGGDYGCVPLSG
jgi:hypothetical protein